VQRIAVLLVVAGCRLHFDDRPPDAAPADAAPPRLVCNTPLRLADAPNAPYVSTTVIGTRLITSWVDGAGTAGGWKIDFTTPDTVMTTVVNVANDTGYDRVAGAATASVLITAFTRGGSSYIDLLDRDFMAVAPETTTSVTVLGPAAAAVTGTASGPIGAVAGNSMLTGQGAIVPVQPNPPPTICDAIQTLRVCELTLGILRGRNAQAVAVSDADVEAAIRFAWDKHRLVVEPGGAAALAALLAGKCEPSEGTVVVVSGGNIDPALHARIVGA